MGFNWFNMVKNNRKRPSQPWTSWTRNRPGNGCNMTDTHSVIEYHI